ncbi:helix-turn-helix domain-containing protein [Paenibacillus eucommiae]|uniref:ABC-type Fe3+-hydroxamate transport system substrate-binding protein n=1 Tax=Paenibacillus eucommiae TaxID=1355755 RepID=A0ABS4IWW6_9BACL|nr:helix-turn-helix domain-containing protein [Paenibacillus eucommiae]MBP1992082.1 ABC-type Fe3+-hydroxamate transport system substrate-binding protein [Paenibacillus eucommiae]
MFSLVLTDVLTLTYGGEDSLELGSSDDYRLLIVIQGRLSMQIQQFNSTAEPGTCTLLLPNHQCSLKVHISSRLYLFTFNAIEQKGNRGASDPLVRSIAGKTHLPLSNLLKWTESIADKPNEQDIVFQLQRQQHFLCLITLLVEQRTHEEQQVCLDPKQSVEETLQFLHNSYSMNVSVQQLADRAHLPRWQYLRSFKQLTGCNPSSYITHLRMEEAKRLLSSTNERIWEVANKVGYDDEQYFNRRFKQLMGISPGQFTRIQNHQHQVTDWRGITRLIPSSAKRIVYDDASTLGDLLALGIAPVGASLRFCSSEPVIHQLERTLERTQDIGFPVNLEKVRELNPDLVLLSRYGYEQCPQASAIAPTVGLNEYAEMPSRLRKLGEILGVHDITKKWLEEYDSRCEKVWRDLQTRKSAQETAVVLFYDSNRKLYLMHRNRGLLRILYHPMGFKRDKHIQHIRPNHGNYYIHVDPNLLEQYAVGDRLFILARPSNNMPAVKKDLQSLPGWSTLPAVKNGSVHFLSSIWNSDDAWTSSYTLNHFTRLWS